MSFKSHHLRVFTKICTSLPIHDTHEASFHFFVTNQLKPFTYWRKTGMTYEIYAKFQNLRHIFSLKTIIHPFCTFYTFYTVYTLTSIVWWLKHASKFKMLHMRNTRKMRISFVRILMRASCTLNRCVITYVTCVTRIALQCRRKVES